MNQVKANGGRLRRRKIIRCAAIAVTAMLGSMSAGTVIAGPKPIFMLAQHDTGARAFMAQRGGGVSLAQATAIASSRYQGRVVRAEPVTRGDRVIYEIRILGDDGRVRTVRIDAQTGAFL